MTEQDYLALSTTANNFEKLAKEYRDLYSRIQILAIIDPEMAENMRKDLLRKVRMTRTTLYQFKHCLAVIKQKEGV